MLPNPKKNPKKINKLESKPNNAQFNESESYIEEEWLSLILDSLNKNIGFLFNKIF